MKIAIIGAGNIATYYGTCFKQHGHEIIQVVSPNEEHARNLAIKLQCCEYALSVKYLNTKADAYLFAVKDDALMEYAKTLTLPEKLVLYAAGAHSVTMFTSMSEEVACIWCVYSIQKDYLPRHRSIPIVVSGTTKNAQYKASKLADSISDLVYNLSDEQKAVAHLGAVICNNFTNHLYHIAKQLMTQKDISFDILKPIIENTAQKIQQLSPDLLQSGPAIRKDHVTINKHLEMLKDVTHWKNVYQTLSDSIMAEN